MLHRILKTFMGIPGVLAVAVVGRDGLVIESESVQGSDLDALGAMASTGIGTLETIGRDLNNGDLDIIISEYTGGKVVMCALSKKELLALVSDPTCQIGKVRYEIKRYRGLLKDLV